MIKLNIQVPLIGERDSATRVAWLQCPAFESCQSAFALFASMGLGTEGNTTLHCTLRSQEPSVRTVPTLGVRYVY